MSVELLDKTRRINSLLHNNHSSKVVFSDICNVLAQSLASNVLVISKKGKVLGQGSDGTVPVMSELVENEIGALVDSKLNDRMLGILSTKENVNLETLGFSRELARQYQAIVMPIEISGERLGTLFLYKGMGYYEIDDIILTEYATTVIGLEMLRSVSEELAEESRREKEVRSALDTLSHSEIRAVMQVVDELHGSKGLLIASRIADQAKITRSVIVNALRKLESAGVIESRSSGMRGTFVRIVNDYLYKELDKLRDESAE